MKTLSKKLLSLLLVAVMLVAAMPFAAFAEDGEEAPQAQAETTYTVIVKLGADKTTATEVARGTYTSATVPDVDDTTGDKAAAILQKVTLNHAFSNAGLKFEAASVKNGNVYIRYSEPTHQHTWEAVSNGATPTQHVVICKTEGASEMQDHVWSEVTGAVAATHTAEGYTGDKHCKACDAIVEKGTEIAKNNNHKFGAWKTTKEATQYADGMKERTCSVCNKVETAKIPRLSDNTDPIHISANGAAKGEQNPNTGAESIIGVVALAAVCTGAYLVGKKKH